MNGRFFEYTPGLHAFEFGHLHSKNVLIFVGGLGDGFLTVPYLPLLSRELNKIGWSLVQIQITGSYTGWGTGSLARDSAEIGKLAAFLKSRAGGSRAHLGLMGHSTGSQNTIHYFTRKPRDMAYAQLDFGILQAPGSDRFAGYVLVPKSVYSEALQLAQKHIEAGHPDELMPIEYCNYFFATPINAYRWNSLFSVRGDDDFFSPDLSPEDFASTFGRFGKPLLGLYSENDEYVPESVDKQAVMDAFGKAAGPFWSPYSKVVKGATHNIGVGSKKGAREDAVATVIKFVRGLDLEWDADESWDIENDVPPQKSGWRFCTIM